MERPKNPKLVDGILICGYIVIGLFLAPICAVLLSAIVWATSKLCWSTFEHLDKLWYEV